MDGEYLLSLDPDRRQYNFGLPSSAKPLGEWEAPYVGHYLSALADSMVAELEKIHEADAKRLHASPRSPRGKSAITVTLQAHPKSAAGAVMEMRTITR